MPTLQEKESPVSVGGILVAFILLLTATLDTWGSFGWTGLILIAAALAVCLWLHLGRDPFRALSAESLLLGLLIGSIALCCCLLAGQYQGTEVYNISSPSGAMLAKWRLTAPGMAIRILSGVALLIMLAWLAGLSPRLRRAAFVALVAIAVAARVLMIFSSPSPKIDVFVSQTMGAKGLLGRYVTVTAVAPQSLAEQRGLHVGDVLLSCGDVEVSSAEELLTAAQSIPPGEPATLMVLREGRTAKLTVPAVAPGKSLEAALGITTARSYASVYSMRFPSPYKDQPFFEHYGYPPLTVYANALSFMLFCDVRGLWVAADIFGALCIFLLARRVTPGERGTRIGMLAALLWLFLPRSLFVIEQSWTEPLCVALLGGLALARGTWAKGAALGLWLASKQYVVVAAPLAVKLRRFGWREWLIACVAGALTLVPFLIWDWQGTYRDVLGFFLTSGTRPDALSLVGMLKRFDVELPWQVVAPLWLAGVVFFTWRMKRTAAGWLFSMASLYLYFFMFGKQAFMNYFYLILFILLLAVAATPGEESDKSVGSDGSDKSG